MTITEALAEIKTLVKRITSKRDFVKQYLVRQDSLKDPLEKDGGSTEALKRELQAIADLEQRMQDLRLGIQAANDKTQLTIEGISQTISNWLVWRREIAPAQEGFYKSIRVHLNSVRDTVRKQGFSMQATPEKPADVVVNINETELAKNIEKLQNILGQLDGQLSLKNATVMI
jgi:SMC interacting uncharacterized protein involved in chromosome segregation